MTHASPVPRLVGLQPLLFRSPMPPLADPVRRSAPLGPGRLLTPGATVIPFPVRPGSERGLPPVPRRARCTRRGRAVLAGVAALLVLAVMVVGRLSLGAAGGTPLAAVPDTAGTAKAATATAATAARAATAGVGVVGRDVAGTTGSGPVAPTGPAPAGWQVLTVGPGDSLWSLARRSAPGRDVREVVHAIAVQNGLATAAIGAGDQLLVPVR